MLTAAGHSARVSSLRPELEGIVQTDTRASFRRTRGPGGKGREDTDEKNTYNYYQDLSGLCRSMGTAVPALVPVY